MKGKLRSLASEAVSMAGWIVVGAVLGVMIWIGCALMLAVIF